VIAPANTTVAVLAGTTTNAAGDVVDADTPTVTGVPALLVERSRNYTNQVDGMPRTVRYGKARVPTGTAVVKDDRVRDEQSGAVYLVEAVFAPKDRQFPADTQLDLKRVR